MAMWNATVRSLQRSWYTLVVGLASLAVIIALTDTWPTTDLSYMPMALALAVGMLLTVRMAPHRAGGALVLLPAMAVDARFGLVALPMLAYAAVVANLIRGMRGPRVISTAGHTVLAYAAADLCAHAAPLVPGWV